MEKIIIEGKVWSGYIGECKHDGRNPFFVIQKEPQDEWNDAIFICDILKKFAGKEVVVIIKSKEAIKMGDWKEWARHNKAEVNEIADKYSGGFMKALVSAFMQADVFNTEKILAAWPEFFEHLYGFKEKSGS